LTGENNPFFGKSHSNDTIFKIIKSKSAYPVYIYNYFKKLLMIYPSVITLGNDIRSNSNTIVNNIDNNRLFRGELYFTRIPFNIEDTPLISEYSSKEGQDITTKIKDNYHVRKAVFVFNLNKKYIRKYDGLLLASKKLNISRETINKHTKSKVPYKEMIFSYEQIL